MVANLWKTHHQPSRARSIALLVVTILPIALLLLNCLALWFDLQEVLSDTTTFYWRHYHDVLGIIQLVTCLALPFAGVGSTVINLLLRRTPWIFFFNITLVLPLIGLCFFVSYLLVFLTGSYEDGGEITLGDNRYALVKIHPYDSEGAIYLGPAICRATSAVFTKYAVLYFLMVLRLLFN